MPYWRLSGFYFFFFAAMGAFVPFWNLYLQKEGYSAEQIGVLSAVFMGTRIFAPNLWAWVADTTGYRVQVIRLGALVATLAFTAILLDLSFTMLALMFVFFSFFWNAVLAQFEVVTLRFLGDQYARYSQIRLWGSIGFIVAASVLGVVFSRFSITYLPIILMVLLASIFVCTCLIDGSRESNATEESQSFSELWVILRQPAIWGFFVVCFLLQVSHGPYYTFYSIYMEELNYRSSVVGLLWSLGVAAEVCIFIVMHKLLHRFGVRKILIASLALATLRWCVIGTMADSLVILLAAQLLHAATFGTFHCAGIELIRQRFPAHFAGQGQAFYSAASFGLGGAVGAYMSGMLWNSLHSGIFLIAAFATLLATIICWALVRGDFE